MKVWWQVCLEMRWRWQKCCRIFSYLLKRLLLFPSECSYGKCWFIRARQQNVQYSIIAIEYNLDIHAVIPLPVHIHFLFPRCHNSYVCTINGANDVREIGYSKEFCFISVSAVLGDRKGYEPLEDMNIWKGVYYSFSDGSADAGLGGAKVRSLLHFCILPVARYLKVMRTFNSGVSGLNLLVSLLIAARTRLVTNNIPSRSNLYLLMSSASLSSFRTSFLR